MGDFPIGVIGQHVLLHVAMVPSPGLEIVLTLPLNMEDKIAQERKWKIKHAPQALTAQVIPK